MSETPLVVLARDALRTLLASRGLPVRGAQDVGLGPNPIVLAERRLSVDELPQAAAELGEKSRVLGLRVFGELTVLLDVPNEVVTDPATGVSLRLMRESWDSGAYVLQVCGSTGETGRGAE